MKWIDLPPVWLLAAGIAAWWLGVLLPQPVFGAWAWPAGVLLIGAGLACMVLAVIAFRRAATTVVPHRVPSAIVTTGIYRYSRNPIYLGDALLLAGLILIWGAVAAILLLPLFVLVIGRRFVVPEEARLAAAFPREFEAWRARTRRWI